MHEAVLWSAMEDGRVQCHLCAHRCVIAQGQTGRCYVRYNEAGTLHTLVYDRLCATHADPIEKKPLFHFQPGTRSFSIATCGCNFQCDFCQNWQISQSPGQGHINGQKITPEQVVEAAVRSNCTSIAYTYTEPTIFMELAADCARLARQRGLRNVFVSNGYMTREAIDFAREWLDAINVDLKAFDDDDYRRLCKARLEPVMETIVRIARETDIWLEVTTLVISGQNDSEDELTRLAQFLVKEAGSHVPWHITRFYPQYGMHNSMPTSLESLERAYEIGKKAGLHYVYLGNIPGSHAESTRCHGCNTVLIERVGYSIGTNRIALNRCPDCGTHVSGVWG